MIIDQPQTPKPEVQQPVQYPVQPSSSKPFFANPIFLILVFIVVAILASFGTYAVLQSKASKPIPTPVVTKQVTSSPTPTPDPTANWKTYQGSGFTLKYPEIIANETVTLKSDNGFALTNSKPPNPVGKIVRNIFVNIEDNNEKLDVKSYLNALIKKNYPDLDMNDPQVAAAIKQEQIVIDNITGLRVTGLPSAYGRIEFYIPKEDKMFYFAFEPYPGERSQKDKEWEQTFSQILSSFKFTP